MKQKLLRKDILFLILFIAWTLITGSLYAFVKVNEDSNTEAIIILFKLIVGVLYFPVGFFPFIFIYIHKQCKAKGEGKPLSLEAMRESKKHIPNKIYKFCSLTNKSNNDELNKSKLKTLSNNEIWLSRFSDLNDPFEGQKFYIPEKDMELPDEIKNKYGVKNVDELIKYLTEFRNKYCQASFSSTNDDVQMWGYYANGCRGYCVEYEVINTDALFPVYYLNKRIILSGFFNNKKYERACIRNLKQLDKSLYRISSQDFLQYNLYLQSFKYSQWAFEKEIRAITIASPYFQGGNQSAKDYGLKPTKIIVGYLSEYIEELKQIAINLGASFSIMEPNYNSNKFELVERNVL
ncbi:MAG: DUF2971 domain-containing protein [Candidatus Coproplasma sp.]